MLRVQCKGCGALYRIPEAVAGKQVRCKKCGRGLAVPGRSGAAVTLESGQGADRKRRRSPRLRQGRGRPERLPPRGRAAAAPDEAGSGARSQHARRSVLFYSGIASMLLVALGGAIYVVVEFTVGGIGGGHGGGASPPVVVPVVFNPDDHLPGYEKATNGDYERLYRYEPFEKRRGKLLTEAGLVKVREEWAKEVQRVEPEIDFIRTDGRRRFLFQTVEPHILGHRFLSSIRWRGNYSLLPFAFYIEEPKKKDVELYVERVVNKYRDRLSHLAGILRREYGEVFSKSERVECFPIFILATEGSHVDFVKAVAEPSLHATLAHFEPPIPLVVTYEDEDAPRDRRLERLHAMLHEFVHALQERFYRGDRREGPMPKPIWFNEGFADYRTAGQTFDVESLEKPPIADQRLRGFVENILATPLREIYGNSIRNLVTAEGPGYRAVLEAAKWRAEAWTRRNPKAPIVLSAEAALGAFYAQSYLFVHFLHGRHRRAMVEYTEAAMAGRSGWETFAGAFDGIAGDELEGRLEVEFLDYVLAAYKKLPRARTLPPGRPPLPDTVTGPTAGSVVAAPPGGTGAPGSPAPASPAPAPEPGIAPPIDLGDLALTAEEWEARLAVAVDLAARGHLRAAVAALEALAAALDEGDSRTRVERERERVREMLTLRDALLQQVERDSFLDLGNVRGRFRGVDFETGTIRLLVAGEEKEIPLSELAPKELRKLAQRADKLVGKRSWLGAYLYLLGGLELRRVGGLSYIDGKDYPRARELRDDLAGYTRLRGLAEVATYLESLARGKPPEERAAAGLALEKLEAMLAAHGENELFTRREAGIRAYAGRLLEPAFDPARAEHLGLGGQVERGAEGGFKLSYSFDDPSELGDFVAAPEYLDGFRRELIDQQGFPRIAAPRSSFEVRDGTLEGLGAACRRHALAFTPRRIRFGLSFGSRNLKSPENLRFLFLLGSCDDGFGHNLQCYQDGTLVALDAEGARVAPGREGFPWAIGQDYHFELIHRGGAVECRVNGQTHSRLDAGTLERGSLFLWLHSNIPVRLSNLQIEGTLDAESLEKARRRWVSQRLGDLFRGS